ncbi:MAG TPA: O-antigen ligase family protein [Terriglobales bacterium]|nr:O-antigen ligase family protein [Terriglobales bacterium]
MSVLAHNDESAILKRALVVSGIACTCAFAGVLSALGVSLVFLGLVALAVFLLVLAYRYPLTGMGGYLAFMPVYTLAFLIAKFLGPSYIGSLEGVDRVILLLFVFILWRKNGVRPVAPDWFLLGAFLFAATKLAGGGNLIALFRDFNFIIAYAAGRVAILSAGREATWAKRAVWIVAVLAVVGMFEVFIVGEAPRTLLYLAVAPEGTDHGALNAAFHGDMYTGLRESSTMFGPLQFAPLCMVALIVWWVYSRRLIPGTMIAAGLICSVTRSAWVGTAGAISILCALMGETKRLLQFATLILALFIAAIPILGLTDYLTATKTGEDPSAESHQESLVDGLTFVLQHPFGVGLGDTEHLTAEGERDAYSVESTYLTVAGRYGLLMLFCFVGFLISTVRLLWPKRTRLAYVAIGVVVGFGTVMMFASLHDVFPLACWLWFPVGLAVRSASESPDRTTSIAAA